MDFFVFLLGEFISIFILFTLLLISRKDLNLGLNNIINRLHIFLIYLIIICIILKSICYILSFFSYSFLIPFYKVFNSLLLAIYPLISFIYALYMSRWLHVSYNLYALLSPCIFNLIICILNLKFDILFKVNIYNYYIKGTYFLLPFCISTFFYFYVLFSTIKKSKYLSKTNFLVFITNVTLVILTNTINIFYPNSVFLSPLTTLLIILNYFLTHRNLHYYEINLNCNNKKALYKEFFYCFNKNIEFTMLYFNIRKIKSINKLLGNTSANNCILDFAHILLMTFKNIGTPFYLYDDKFILIIKNNNNCDITKILQTLDNTLKNINQTSNKPYLINYDCKINTFSDFTSLNYYLYKLTYFLTSYSTK